MYQVELIWNREFTFVPFGKEHEDLEKAKEFAKAALYIGDGASVKKTRVIELDTGEIIAEY